MASIKDPGETDGRLIAVSKVNGTNVYNTAHEKLGHIYEVMLDKASGKAEYAILSFGGFLGIGDKFHPLPWNQLKYDTNQGGYVVSLDRSHLEGAPAFAADEMSAWDDKRGHDVDTYYGKVTGIYVPPVSY